VLSYADAARTIRAHALLLTARSDNVETLPLLEALGRILAAPVIADRDQPPFARSARDGFACKTADLARSEDLLVVGQLRAGEVWTGPALEPGQVIEIMTGAPVPDGADCVLMVEHAAVNGKRIRRSKQLAAGENIVPAGTEAKTGSVVIPAGTRISPHHIAAAAGFGYSTLVTFARPRVAILATGDELVPVNVEPLQHQIRNSNSYSLAARVLEQRAKPILFPIVHDDLTVIEAAIADAIACDLLILSGGVSMGKYDFVEQALLNL
jgi:molybdopterin molybdotransferase